MLPDDTIFSHWCALTFDILYSSELHTEKKDVPLFLESNKVGKRIGRYVLWGEAKDAWIVKSGEKKAKR